jgi:hypothetical protein
LVIDQEGRPHISYLYGLELRYAYYNGTSWQIETVTSGEGSTSLALDSAGLAHISYYNPEEDCLKYAHQEPCLHLDEVNIRGPSFLPLGISGLYSADHNPLTPTLPVTFTWDNGTVGPTAAYAWTVTGTYSFAVTATNPCNQVQGSFTVTVFCQPAEGAQISGPPVWVIGRPASYRAEAEPITTSPPISFAWDTGRSFGTAGNFSFVEIAGASSLTATYSWATTGTYTLTVTATNPCGQAQGSYSVRVLAEWPYKFYLPLVPRNDP